MARRAYGAQDVKKSSHDKADFRAEPGLDEDADAWAGQRRCSAERTETIPRRDPSVA
jgi:hypothetical protein